MAKHEMPREYPGALRSHYAKRIAAAVCNRRLAYLIVLWKPVVRPGLINQDAEAGEVDLPPRELEDFTSPHTDIRS